MAMREQLLQVMIHAKTVIRSQSEEGSNTDGTSGSYKDLTMGITQSGSGRTMGYQQNLGQGMKTLQQGAMLHKCGSCLKERPTPSLSNILEP
jgi:hypothetical protein